MKHTAPILSQPTVIRLRPAAGPLPLFRPRIFADTSRPSAKHPTKGRTLIRLIGLVVGLQLGMPLATMLGANGFVIYCAILIVATLAALTLGVCKMWRARK